MSIGGISAKNTTTYEQNLMEVTAETFENLFGHRGGKSGELSDLIAKTTPQNKNVEFFYNMPGSNVRGSLAVNYKPEEAQVEVRTELTESSKEFDESCIEPLDQLTGDYISVVDDGQNVRIEAEFDIDSYENAEWLESDIRDIAHASRALDGMYGDTAEEMGVIGFYAS